MADIGLQAVDGQDKVAVWITCELVCAISPTGFREKLNFRSDTGSPIEIPHPAHWMEEGLGD